MAYHRTQVGKVLLAAFASAAVALAVLAAFSGDPYPPLAVAGTLVLLGVLFGTLTVEVDREAVRVRFGPGLVRRTLLLSRVRGARAVRNRWWYGWGLKRTRHGWLYAVSGLEAVEVLLEDGRRVRIGTDRPRELERAVRSAAGLDG